MKKKEILKYIDILEMANTEMAQGNSNWKDYELVLCESQQCAIVIGNDIEKRGESSKNIIEKLEVYCEEIYQLSLVLQNKETIKKRINHMQRLLTEIRNGIKFELSPDVKEIVFLPYKSSMWDSMESVWIAAAKNPFMECHVVPIPYFDRTSKGELGEMHYEGMDYPAYVPIESWKEYLIPQHKPDIIFIHNPYDQFNYVTCVHPNFFSEELRRYTDHLVYLPYFYTNKLFPEMHLQLPAYEHVDTIVVQNELVKKQFHRSNYEKKIVSLGSPKLDCILNYSKEKRYPEQLGQYISDGKKIVLLNTGISTFLENGEMAIQKILNAVSIAASVENVILVWRPHPLLEATIKSMRPDKYEKFLESKSLFISNNNCILDTGMNLNELVASCDAYIGGEESSLVVLFASLGKPVYILDNDRVFEKKYNEFFFDIYKSGEDIFFAHGEYPGICHANLRDGKVDEIIPIDSKEPQEYRLYTECVEHHRKLYFSPMQASEVVEFNISEKKIRTIQIKNTRTQNFNKAIKMDDSIWFIPTLNESILEFDLKNNTQIYHTKPINVIADNACEKGYYSMFASCCIGNSIYIASPTSNMIVQYEVTTKRIEKYSVGKKNSGYWHMINDEDNIWLVPYKGHAIVRWNISTNAIDEFDQFPESFEMYEEDKDYFLQLVNCDEFLLVFPKRANMILRIDKATGKLTEWSFGVSYCEGDRKNSGYWWPSNYYFAKRIGEFVYAHTAYDNSLLEIDLKNNAYRTIQIRIPKELKKVTYEKKFKKNRYNELDDYFYRESAVRSLTVFLELLNEGKIGFIKEEQGAFLKTMKNSDGTAGEKILEYVAAE